ncbi:hypothetical protein M378DRAFT_156662 [Amanita muscaria Koide BX008]|uniref:Uncharacterized protein n=1 Tax=Amanita muscaria (strain Koide BX008) TaxID=946122 RepID=A0A0C2XLX9_AMAMK|nr:hypothetical protein M378DRAFT_156662 [Amanita muscaria Koide BX008]
MQDTLPTLAGISGNTLLSLQITVPDNAAADDAIDIIANDFPRLEFRTIDTKHELMVSNLDFLMLPQIRRLRHLRLGRFTYIFLGKRLGEGRVRFEQGAYENSKPWDHIVQYVVKNCPSVDVLGLGSILSGAGERASPVCICYVL